MPSNVGMIHNISICLSKYIRKTKTHTPLGSYTVSNTELRISKAISILEMWNIDQKKAHTNAIKLRYDS